MIATMVEFVKPFLVEKSFIAFFILTVVLGGSAAFVTGRASARGWKPLTHALLYTLLLGAAVRFLHWGLFLEATLESWRGVQGTLLSPYYYGVDTVTLMALATLGYRIERARQMCMQYGWIYERDSLLVWKKR
jgi:hypothetical protein